MHGFERWLVAVSQLSLPQELILLTLSFHDEARLIKRFAQQMLDSIHVRNPFGINLRPDEIALYKHKVLEAVNLAETRRDIVRVMIELNF